jgi:hypothetical protein
MGLTPLLREGMWGIHPETSQVMMRVHAAVTNCWMTKAQYPNPFHAKKHALPNPMDIEVTSISASARKRICRVSKA